MWKYFYADGQLLGFALFALIFFLGFFLTVIVRLLRQDRRQIDALAALPLLDDAPAQPKRGEQHHG